MFHVDIAKFLRTAFFIEHLRWLLLTILPQHNKARWGACSLNLHLQVSLILIKNFRKALHK